MKANVKKMMTKTMMMNNKSKMKLILNTFIYVSFLIFLSISSVYAEEETGGYSTGYQGGYEDSSSGTFANLPPGSSEGTIHYQKSFNDAFKIEETASLKELVRRNDSVLDLTCFGQQLAILSTLGNLFSDMTFDVSGLDWASILCGPGIGAVFGGKLYAALQLLFNIPWGIPPYTICGPTYSIGADIAAAMSEYFNYNILGCVASLGIDAFANANFSAEFQSPCATIDFSAWGLGCNKMGDFWNKSGNGGNPISDLFGGSGVNIQPVEGGGTNQGGYYLTSGQLLNLSGSAGATADARAEALFSGGGGLDASFSANFNLEDGFSTSGDGLTTGNDFNAGLGYNATAGSGISFLGEIGSDENSDDMDAAGEANDDLSGPGEGSDSWQESPSFDDDATVDDVVEQMNP